MICMRYNAVYYTIVFYVLGFLRRDRSENMIGLKTNYIHIICEQLIADDSRKYPGWEGTVMTPYWEDSYRHWMT